MYELTIKSDFASAHFVRITQATVKICTGIRGRWRFTLESGRLDTTGMVVDFKVIKQQLKDF